MNLCGLFLSYAFLITNLYAVEAKQIAGYGDSSNIRQSSRAIYSSDWFQSFVDTLNKQDDANLSSKKASPELERNYKNNFAEITAKRELIFSEPEQSQENEEKDENILSISRPNMDSSTDTSKELEDSEKDGSTEETLEMLPTPAFWVDAPTCPAWGSMDGFYALGIQDTQYMGRWFLQAKTKDISDYSEHCWTIEYTLNRRRGTISRQSHYFTLIGNLKREEEGEVEISEPLDPNLLLYRSNDGLLPSLIPGSESWIRVLATDYETFSIEYTCSDSNLIKRQENIWIYTRERIPGTSVLNRAYRTLVRLNLQGYKLLRTDQGKCPIPERTEIREHVDPPMPRNSKIGPPSTEEKTMMLLSGGLRLVQSLLAPWTLHPVLGFTPTQPETERREMKPFRRSFNEAKRKNIYRGLRTRKENRYSPGYK
ncbi:uncharacterized protein LOC111696794 isoform X2 [Eurytemora carolleeae]|uniref:uncharacterized protein LOC111696794 isoform X2 n=1 Tax=Eurytemora carolleeae TaxID=1294199 RepID=UPI000C76AA91|nr:uncharacterized protein LOC111696794 isoform X2 [Eurytemora carolleeae]|eukprot:XP_023322307.1 uncharacterized protein LOC111696794 isoform X2 [Eurytemora affinis]